MIIYEIKDYEVTSTKVRVKLWSKTPTMEVSVSTAFSLGDMDRYVEYKKKVEKVFNEIERDYNATMADRITDR